MGGGMGMGMGGGIGDGIGMGMGSGMSIGGGMGGGMGMGMGSGIGNGIGMGGGMNAGMGLVGAGSSSSSSSQNLNSWPLGAPGGTFSDNKLSRQETYRKGVELTHQLHSALTANNVCMPRHMWEDVYRITSQIKEPCCYSYQDYRLQEQLNVIGSLGRTVGFAIDLDAPIFRNAPETSLKTLADRCGFGDELTRLSKNINVMGVQAARKN